MYTSRSTSSQECRISRPQLTCSPLFPIFCSSFFSKPMESLVTVFVCLLYSSMSFDLFFFNLRSDTLPRVYGEGLEFGSGWARRREGGEGGGHGTYRLALWAVWAVHRTWLTVSLYWGEKKRIFPQNNHAQKRTRAQTKAYTNHNKNKSMMTKHMMTTKMIWGGYDE